MMEQQKPFYTVEDIIKATGLSRGYISQLIQQNVFHPSNAEYRYMDGGKYHFAPEEFQRIVAMYQVDGLTTGAVAERLGVSVTTVHQLIKRGELPAEKRRYGKQKRFYVKEEEVEQYIVNNGKKSNETLYHEDTGYFLYQSFYNGDIHGRITQLMEDGSGILTTASNQELPLKDSIQMGFQPRPQQLNQEYITKKGWVTFALEKPKYVDSIAANVLEQLLIGVGPKNIRIENALENILYVEVKPCLLKELGADGIQLLKRSLRSGFVLEYPRGILLKSNLVNVPTTIDVDLKLEMEQLAKAYGMSMSEWIAQAIEEKVERDKGVDTVDG